jgi:hypothetical protein
MASHLGWTSAGICRRPGVGGRERGMGPLCSAAPPASRRAVRSPPTHSRQPPPAQHCSGCGLEPRGSGHTWGAGLAAPPPSQLALPPPPAFSPRDSRRRPAAGYGLGSLVGWSASATAPAAAAALGVPPARPPPLQQQPSAGMGSVSGRSGRAWTPLRVRCRGWRCVGRPPCRLVVLYNAPPVAPCRCPGAPKCMRAVSAPGHSVLRAAARARAGGWETWLDGTPQRARTTVSGLPLQHANLCPPCCGRGGSLRPPLRAEGLVARSGRPPWARWLRFSFRWDCAGPPIGGTPGLLGMGCARSRATPLFFSPLCASCLPAACSALQLFCCIMRSPPLSLWIARDNCIARDPAPYKASHCAHVLALASPAFARVPVHAILSLALLVFCPGAPQPCSGAYASNPTGARPSCRLRL